MTVSLLKYESFNSSMHFSQKKWKYIYTKGPCTQIFFCGGGGGFSSFPIKMYATDD